ncbi:MAG: TlpA family protein disulfide reductase [Muribaculaceae bacterium]|nr:TlpA family protein disulfide reductase [Muribaculaceae bacterium]
MKKAIPFAAAATLILAACSSDKGSVTIQLPADYSENSLVVSHMTIKNMFEATQVEDLTVIYDTLLVKNGVAELRLDTAGPARYSIEPPVMTTLQPEFYAEPKEELKVTIKSFEPLDYDVKGSQLMEDIMAYNAVINPIQQEYMSLVSRNADASSEELQEMMKEHMNRYDEAIKKFVTENPNSPAVAYVITDLSGDEFKEYYEAMTPEAKKSILMPYAEAYNKDVEDMQSQRDEEEARKAEVASGTIEAPGFTLPDLAGKKVSLSDFRGKWVVLDFWGSWCGWCVKGFPALKEAYKKYGDKIVVIGIDCNESEAEWREGVKKHELPWINLYNGMDQELYKAYNITGFPTKAIINPEGKLVDLTTGEDPSFFTRLASFINS